MGVLTGTAGLLFKIDADSSDAIKDLNKVDATIGSLGDKMGSIGGAAAVATAAVAAIGAAAIGAGAAIFNLTRNAAEYGSVIWDAKEKTGLSAATLSTLKLSADNAGSSLEQVTSGAAKFAKMLGEARDGDEKAVASMKALGVTTFDLDKALGQATSTIANAKEGTDQIVLSQKAFGKAGADLIPVIKQMGGDLTAATKEAERLGTTLSEKDIAASDQFGDSLGLLSSQAKAAAVAFTSDLMVAMSSYFTAASEWYARNQNEVRAWGTSLSDTVSGVVISFGKLIDVLPLSAGAFGAYFYKTSQDADTWSNKMAEAAKHVGFWFGALGALAEGAGRDQREAGVVWEYSSEYERAPIGKPSPSFKTPSAGKSGPKGKTQEQLDREDEQRRKKAFDERVAEINRLEAEYEASAARILAKAELWLEQGKLDEQSFAETKIAIAASVAAKKSYYLALEYEAAVAFGQATADIESKQLVQREKNSADAFKNQIERQKLVNKAEKEFHDALDKYDEDDKKRHEDWKERVKDQLEFLEKMRAEAEGMWQDAEDQRKKDRQAADDKKQAEYDASPMGRAVKSWKDLKTAMESVVGMQNILGGFFSMAVDGFMNMANAVGSAVASWALYGESIGKALRKALAAELAHIAAVSVVNALYATALGFLRLAHHDYPGAAAAFTSAAIWAAVGGAAAIGARAVAGDAFKQQTNTSTGQTSNASSGQGNGGGKGVYSSQKDQVVEVGRNDPGNRGLLGMLQSHITLKIESTTAHIVDVVTQNIQGNGQLRTVIQDAT